LSNRLQQADFSIFKLNEVKKNPPKTKNQSKTLYDAPKPRQYKSFLPGFFSKKPRLSTRII
jgi:hypothetical protein